MPLAAFCPACGGRIVRRAARGGLCGGCGREVFANPKPAAGVFLERDGLVLLVRRGAEPAKGYWDVPGGFLEEGETPEACARREIREELGVELGVLGLAMVDLNPAGPDAVLDVLYETRVVYGEPIAGSDAAELGWFAPDALPADLAFESTRRILALPSRSLTTWRPATWPRSWREHRRRCARLPAAVARAAWPCLQACPAWPP